MVWSFPKVVCVLRYINVTLHCVTLTHAFSLLAFSMPFSRYSRSVTVILSSALASFGHPSASGRHTNTLPSSSGGGRHVPVSAVTARAELCAVGAASCDRQVAGVPPVARASCERRNDHNAPSDAAPAPAHGLRPVATAPPRPGRRISHIEPRNDGPCGAHSRGRRARGAEAASHHQA